MMKAGLCPLLLMETVICDSKLSQLSFSTTSAHSSNAQPSSKRKVLLWRKKKACGRKTIQVQAIFDFLIKNLRIREL